MTLAEYNAFALDLIWAMTWSILAMFLFMVFVYMVGRTVRLIGRLLIGKWEP